MLEGAGVAVASALCSARPSRCLSHVFVATLLVPVALRFLLALPSGVPSSGVWGALCCAEGSPGALPAVLPPTPCPVAHTSWLCVAGTVRARRHQLLRYPAAECPGPRGSCGHWRLERVHTPVPSSGLLRKCSLLTDSCSEPVDHSWWAQGPHGVQGLRRGDVSTRPTCCAVA